MRAAEANRIEADYLQNTKDFDSAMAYLAIPNDHIAPVHKTLCLGFIRQHATLSGTPEEMVEQFTARGLQVIFRRDHIYYDTFEEVPWD